MQIKMFQNLTKCSKNCSEFKISELNEACKLNTYQMDVFQAEVDSIFEKSRQVFAPAVLHAPFLQNWDSKVTG